MGKRILNHYLNHPDYIRDVEVFRKIKRWARLVSSKSDRKKAIGADVIVTTSGMLDGGPAHWYLNRLRHDQRNAILLTGYQAEGSGGRQMLDDSRLKIFGKLVDINLEVDQFSFSNHADNPLLVDFAKQVAADDVILFHGNRDAGQELFKNELESEGMTIHQPENCQSYLI
jgi:putative mRNA 3-end processing factor